MRRLWLRLVLRRRFWTGLRMARIAVVGAPRIVLRVLTLLSMLRPAAALLLRLPFIRLTRLLVQGIARLEARDHAHFHLAVHELLDVFHQRNGDAERECQIELAGDETENRR